VPPFRHLAGDAAQAEPPAIRRARDVRNRQRPDGGVPFLDEVSEMSLSQAKFLRFLQERERCCARTADVDRRETA
jgi:hypothetical protein